MYLAADISLGVGAPRSERRRTFSRRPVRAREAATETASYVVDVAPSRSGVFASVSGAF